MDDYDARIAKFVENKRQRLESQATTSSKLAVILGECGWKKRSPQNLQQIQAALDAAGLFTEPRLTMRTDADTRIYLSAEPIDNRSLFANESDLRDFIVSNFDRIADLDHLRDPKAEVRLPSKRRVDILARGKDDDAYVVIELKKAAGDVIDDMTHYLREVDATRAKGRYPVRGLIILGTPAPHLSDTHPTIAGYTVEWKTYRASLSLED